MKRLTPVFIILLLASLVACDRTKAPKPVSATKSASSSASTPSSQPGSPPMQKYVTDQAGFVLYMPQGWTAKEGAQGQTQTVSVGDPSGQYSVFLCYGPDPTRQDIMGLARFFAGAIIKQFSGAEIRKSMMSPDKKHVVFEGTYMDPQQRKKFFRAWVTGGDGNFSFSSIETPIGRFDESRQLLLTILSNISAVKGSTRTTAPPKLPLVQYRLHDGSATFLAPQGWQHQSFGTGAFAATDPSGHSSFIVGAVNFLTPQLRVRVPNTIVSNYLPPHQAMQLVTSRMNLASGMQFAQVIPKPDLNRQIGQVFTAGPVQAEEFVYTFTAKGRQCKAYTFGISFGSRLNTDWKFWHITVAAPVEEFDRMTPTFVSMVQSYGINDQFARNYIAQGMARLRQMEQETARIVARNASEIRQMMQSVYDERQRSNEYIDYQRTSYIRGTSDWISGVEGGTVYHTDSWGTKNTTTGDYYQGQPFNYYNHTGQNPRYNEQMQEINSRALYEAHMR